ncbi:MAG: PHB depolymerase family esterase [Acidimicrobiales bacterium]
MTRPRPSTRYRLGVAVAAVLLLAASCGDDATQSTAQEELGEPTTSLAAEPSETVAPTTAADSPTTKPPEAEPSATNEGVAEPTTTAAPVSAAAQPTGPGCESLEPGVTSLTMTSGGADHPVRIFVPSGFAGEPLPVVVNWHGLGSNGPEQATYSGYETVAESEGFIAVHPTGVPAPGNNQNSWELADAQDPTRDDLAFAVELFDDLVASWCVDDDRIFSTGMSNGGFFTARLVCEIPERLAGAISVAGVFHPPGCSPSETVPFMAFHGTADGVVPFDGSGESSLAEPGDQASAEFFSQIMPDEFSEFAADAGCGPVEETEVSVEVIRFDYPDCGVPMAFFEVVDGGHTWPGSPLAAMTQVLGFTTDDVSATVDGWAFFESVS